MNKIFDVAAVMKGILARITFMKKVFTVVATIEKIEILDHL
jgi:hypothetical protein